MKPLLILGNHGNHSPLLRIWDEIPPLVGDDLAPYFDHATAPTHFGRVDWFGSITFSKRRRRNRRGHWPKHAQRTRRHKGLLNRNRPGNQ